MFEISFTGESWIDEGVPYRAVRLVLPEGVEEDNADLTSWTVQDYERQWFCELSAIANDKIKGALVTSIHDPSQGYRIGTWPMWRDGHQVRFQNRILFMLDAIAEFDAARVSDHIAEYQSHNEEGQRLSEWLVPIADINNFIERVRAMGDQCSTHS